MTQKQRNIFALKNFRGLDKENKLLKVEPYRATDGFNFIIDSETLKTRPSFTVAHDPNFFLENDDYLIDWHIFGQVYIYITKKHIYIVNGNVVLNELSSSTSLIKSPFQTSLNFEGLRPLFQEEKDCLFIFCLNEIYVISILKNQSGEISHYVLYKLREKPTNPFTITGQTFFEEQFDKLPTPYVPTILLGNNSFEDVNLLSNQSKYKLFANVPTTTNGKVIYTLPTYYDVKKHGTFTPDDVKVSFFNGRYEGYKTFPVFMGVHTEDFFGVINTNAAGFGTLVNAGSPYLIQNTHFPTKPFEYANTSPESIIFERLYLNKKDFFEFRLATQSAPGNPTVFEFLMDYISLNKASLTENKVLVFTLPVQNEVILRDNSTNNIVSQSVRQKNFAVYVQLKSFDEDWSLVNETIANNSLTTTNLDPANYPEYPAFVSPLPDQAEQFLLNSGNPILTTGSVSDITNQFTEMARLRVAENVVPLTDEDRVGVRGKFYTVSFVTTPRTIIFPTSIQQDVLEQNTSNYLLYSVNPSVVYPSYPVFDNSAGYSVKDFDIVDETSGDFDFTFAEGTPERTQLITLITNFVNSGNLGGFDIDRGFGIFKAKMYKRTNYKFPIDDGQGNLVYGNDYTSAVVVKVAISSGIATQETRYSFTYTAKYEEDPTPIYTSPTEQNIYEITLKENNKIIELKVEDYFFDYKNEPSIEVLVSFQQNTEYNIIAQSKFGATFGSENRLFLAGNTEFPNIDRFNVSNDLLGNNITNQSYELTYFPSKNYRVLGGKGAINGYVTATDNQLYVTKEDYPNDSKLFIRQRNINEQGVVNYAEFKTNITKTPLNNRCLVRFYNDILVLAKDGLFGIEISQNALTDERLVRLRSGYINKELVKAMSNYDNKKIFILENNIYMYIFIGEKVYVADSRYISQNPNSAAENVSYEIIEWQVPMIYIGGKIINEKMYAIRENDSFIYSVEDFNSDEIAKKRSSSILRYNYQNSDTSEDTNYLLFGLLGNYPEVFQAPNDYVLRFYNMGTQHAYILKGELNNGYTVSGNTLTTTIISNFVDISVGDTLYWFNGSSFIPFTILTMPSLNTFTFSGSFSSAYTQVYSRVTNKDLYVKYIIFNGGNNLVSLTNLKPDSAITIPSGTDAERKTTLTKWQNILFSNADLTLNAVVLRDVIAYKKIRIPMRWVSAITDFGNSQMEKTSFRVNLYATKKEETNDIAFGYRTMRRMAGFASAVDLSNNFDFEEVDYSQFTMATFNTTALSFPMKENNFLYIQFTLNGVGKIEMNGVEVIYKLNRMLKSVG